MTSQKDLKKRRSSKAETRFILFWASLKTLLADLVRYTSYLWQHNPFQIISQRQRRLYFVENYGEVMIKPKMTERILDVFLSDYRRRKRLLNWVHSKNRNADVVDFSTSWQDGIALCALLESLCPGVCPSYHLLSQHNRVKNCRLGLKLANKYMYVPMDLVSPEEMAIANKASENKIMQYISMLKWASENIKEKWTSLHESLIAAKSGRCFAKGSGLRNGIVGKRSKFTLIVSDTIGVFNMLVEVRGPNNEYCGERLVSLHQAKGVLDKSFDINSTYSDTIKYLEDGAGNTFIRKKVPPRYALDSGDLIHMDLQCGEEGTFYVTFVPRRAGIHAVAVKWQNHHVENSPFRIKVYKASNVSTKTLKGAQEKRVIYDSLSFTTNGGSSLDSLDNLEDVPVQEKETKDGRSVAAIAKSKAYCTGRQLTVTRRRVLRRIITRNGEDIVIEEAISPSLSRQSSITDNSDDDYRIQRKDKDIRSPSTNVQSTTLSHPHNTSQTNTVVALGTVPEERQNSKDDSTRTEVSVNQTGLNNSENLSTPIKPDSKEPKFQNNPDDRCIDHKKEQEMTSCEQILTKYNTTELNGHNAQVINNKFVGDNADKHSLNALSQNVTLENDTQKMVLDNGTVPQTATRTQKAPLKRTFSIHEYQKPVARRTTSDGVVYQLRKRLLSLGTKDRSDTDTEISSDDKNSNDDEDEGQMSPAGLKVLHSDSLKKACMYISDKAFSRTFSSVADDDGQNIMDNAVIANQNKAKLRATRSLPVMLRMWRTNARNSKTRTDDGTNYFYGTNAWSDHVRDINDVENSFVDNEIERSFCDNLENIMTVDKDGNVIKRSVSVNEGIVKERRRSKNQAEFHSDMSNLRGLHSYTNYHVINAGNGGSMLNNGSGRGTNIATDAISYPPAYTNENGSFEEAIKELESLTSPNSEKSSRQRSSKYSFGKDCKYISKYRQDVMQRPTNNGRRSSGDSSTDTEKQAKQIGASVETFIGNGSGVNSNSDFTHVFQSINMSQERGRENIEEVFILMPKAKVDKSSQVSEAEIKRETGWDIIQGIYPLLKRISIKVPGTIAPNLNDESESIASAPQASSMKCVSTSPEEDKDTNFIEQVHVKLDPYDVPTNDTGNLEDVPAIENIDDGPGNAATKNATGDKLLRVNAWLQSHGVNNTQMSPVRQITVETVDSGFDDNLTYNRQARFSLPSLRTVNGHVRLHRRPYRGQIFLDRKLVVSSSQSMSKDRPEQGHEADDELHNSSLEHHITQKRRRHRMPCRNDSISISDSEISQRRQTTRKRVFAKKRYAARETACDNRNGKLDKTNVTQDGDEELQNMNQGRMVGNTRSQEKNHEITDSGEDKDLGTSKEPVTNKVNKMCPSSLLRNRSSTRSKSSSLESNYFGFGISKHGRDSLLSQIGEFQNLYPTEEVTVEEGMVYNNPSVYAGYDVSAGELVDMTDGGVHIEDRNCDENGEELGAMGFRSQSWDGIFNENSLEIEFQNEAENTPDASRSVLESDSASDDMEHVSGNIGSDDVFDMFSSFDHSHMNDVLPIQDNFRSMNTESCDTLDVEISDATSTQTMVRVAGVGHRYGQVGSSNSFQVWIENPTSGSLSVNVIGPRAHTVAETSVIYTGDNLYEVSYGVTQPGFYKIYIRWGNVDIPQCPYICEVTL